MKVNNNEFLTWYHKKFTPCYSKNEWLWIYEDQLAILNLITKYDIKSYLEIGTYKGYTSMLVWLHPNIERVLAVDIHKDLGIPFYEGEHTKLLDKSEYGQYFKNTPAEIVFCDSKKWTTDEKFDMVYIDAKHDAENSTANGELARKISNKIVAFHDSTYPKYGVVQYLDKIRKEGKTVTIFDGTTVGYFEV